MFLSMLEEAHTQYALERSMTGDDWSAWEATADRFIQRRYIAGYWQNVRATFEPSFRRFIDTRLIQAGADPFVTQAPASEA
jgi:hypothetical protein